MSEIKNRYDFMLVFDVKDGNPNGDPDAGNLPRVDAETGQGLVTDVCLKRKVRNYIQLTQGDRVGYDIFVKEKAILNKELPYTVGGGIGQSRICMFFLRKCHIGEIQVSVWPQEIYDQAAEKGITIL